MMMSPALTDDPVVTRIFPIVPDVGAVMYVVGIFKTSMWSLIDDREVHDSWFVLFEDYLKIYMDNDGGKSELELQNT
jgi:hypothetical protein